MSDCVQLLSLGEEFTLMRNINGGPKIHMSIQKKGGREEQ